MAWLPPSDDRPPPVILPDGKTPEQESYDAMFMLAMVGCFGFVVLVVAAAVVLVILL